VYLNGTVDNTEMKSHAASIAGRVADVRDIVNNLQVRTQ
jgi:osmotically-inducible protein OsmY